MSVRVRTYEEAIRFLFDRIDFERMDPPPERAFKLDRMRQLLSLLSDPHMQIPAVHIAGTKGKGSTAAMISGALTAAGYRTALFTSPHLAVFEERIRVDGRMPEQAQIVDLVNRLAGPVAALDNAPSPSRPTFFEIATAMAWLHFLDQRAEIVILEVGVGGRLDATNLCRPIVTVITNISRDHTALLGATLAEIAVEKAGILKRGVPLISGATNPEAADVIEQLAREQSCKLMRLGREIQVRQVPKPASEGEPGSVNVETPHGTWNDVRLGLRGGHQASNAALALAVLGALRTQLRAIPDEAIRAGIANVQWPGRIEVIGASPTIVLDAAHNWASAAALGGTITREFTARRRILLLAATRDKDVTGLVRQLVPAFDSVIVTQYQTNPRAVAVAHLQRVVRTICDKPVHVAPNPADAWKVAQRIAEPPDLICIAGSFFIVAELRNQILQSASWPQNKNAPDEQRPARRTVLKSSR